MFPFILRVKLLRILKFMQWSIYNTGWSAVICFFALKAVAALLVEESGECAWLIVADGRFIFVCLSVAIMH